MSDAPNETGDSSDQSLFHLPPALRHPNFRLFFIGQAVSLIGTWMQTTALRWLVWELERKPSFLGYISFAAQIPNLFFTPLAGVIADRHSRHRLVIFTQTLALIQASALAWLTLSGSAKFPYLMGLAFFTGLINAFDMPTRQSFVVELTGTRDLPNAIALNSMAFNMARLTGPPIAGFLINWLSSRRILGLDSITAAGMIFLVNAISYIWVIGALTKIKLSPRAAVIHSQNMMQHLKEGMRFVASHTAPRDALLYVGLLSFVGLPFQDMMPAVASQVFHGDAKDYAFLLSAIGLGALIGAICLLRGSFHERLDLLIPAAGLGFGLGLIVLSFVRTIWIGFAVLVPTGSALMIQTLSINTFLQRIVPDRLRGRVMSFYTMMLLGLYPLGSVVVGHLAEKLGLMPTARFSGFCCMSGAIVFFIRLKAIRASAKDLSNADEA